MAAKEQLYCSGDRIHAGDAVRYAGVPGIVVFVNDSVEYLPDFTAADWSYLGSGFMIRQENGALIYQEEADEDLELIRRAEPDAGPNRRSAL